MKRRRRKNFSSGMIFIALGIGVVLVCIFPTKWMLVVLAAALVAAGCMMNH